MLPSGLPAPMPIRMLGTIIDWSIVAIGAVMVIQVFLNVLIN